MRGWVIEVGRPPQALPIIPQFSDETVMHMRDGRENINRAIALNIGRPRNGLRTVMQQTNGLFGL